MPTPEPVLLSDGTLEQEYILEGNQKPQHDFLADCAPGWTCAQGGWGSGKTWAGARKFLWLHLYNECPGMVVALTHDALWLLCVPELSRACDEMGLVYTTHPHGRGVNKKPHMIIEDQPVWLFSADAPENITGIEVGHIWGDEAARYPASREEPLRNALLQMRGRLRHKGAKVLHGLLTTTPEGTETPIESDFADEKTRKPEHRIFYLPTRGNTALPAQYITELLGSTPANLVDQYLDGKAVNVVGNRAHPTFAEATHVRVVEWDDKLPLHLGADYNVSPMCWVAVQIVGDEVRVLDEVVLDDFGQVDAAMQRAHDQGWGARFVKLHPDKSAKARSTVGDPEFTAMRNAATRLAWRFTGDAHGANPPVDARINLLSRTILDATGKRRLVVHPRCTRVISDLAKTARASNGYDPGPDGKRGHILDALGYVVWDECRPGNAITARSLSRGIPWDAARV